MAEATKHINGGNLLSEFKSLFSLIRTKRSIAFAYGFMFAFVIFTASLAFINPSSNSSSPWFSNIFSTSTSSSHSTIFSDESYRSHFSSIFSYFFPNSTQQSHDFASPRSQNPTTNQTQNVHKVDAPQNQTQMEDFEPKQSKNQTQNGEKVVAPKNQTQTEGFRQKQSTNQTQIGDKVDAPKNQTHNEDLKPKKQSTNQTKKSVPEAFSDVKNQGKGNYSGVSAVQGKGDVVERLKGCDLFDGEWVRDDSYPLYKPGSCSLIDEQFNCFLSGRPDTGFQKLKWKPKGCNIPRLNGSHMLEMLKGKRLVYVGDSLNRNMWESLVCILKNAVKDQTKVYEAHGRDHFRSEAHYSFIFEDYNCTVEFFVAPFLVQEWERTDKNGTKRETLRIDLIARSAEHYKTADILVFNTGHWWTHDKTAKGADYYQEGSHVYNELDVLEAFRRALTTWGRWVDANINPNKSLVLFRGYSASHFSGGQWNSGGQCDHETEPIKNTTYLTPYPPKMKVLESVLKGMKTRVSYLNITRLTDYRKDGHPSVYRKPNLPKEESKIQDCSHWCLPGVPDAWNELLYAELLVKQNQLQHKRS